MITNDEIPEKLLTVLKSLLEGFEYSKDGDRWLFAVEIDQFLSKGISTNDLRWLTQIGVVEHGREVTIPGDDGREFRRTGSMTFVAESCFVLTDHGVQVARSFCHEAEDANAGPSVLGDKAKIVTKRIIPNWDANRRELWYADTIVKWFRWQAINQERVLSAFEEDGWPSVIDDPLWQEPDQDPKRRLHDTIKCLNRNQKNKLISFHGNGDGQTIRWEAVTKVDSPPKSEPCKQCRH